MRTLLRCAVLFSAVSGATVLGAQDPIKTYSESFEARFNRSQPVIRYTIQANPPVDSLGYSVTIIVRNLHDTVRIASPFWAPGAYRAANFHRYIHNVRVTKNDVTIPVARQDSSTWRFVVPRGLGGTASPIREDESRGETVIQYEVRYPTAVAAAGLGNYSFLRPDGALLSGPMTYLYIVGHQPTPAHVTFQLPAGWKIASGLTPTLDPKTFFAPSYDVLADCPVLIGANLRIWSFEVDGVPHRIAYYPTAETSKKIPFDSTGWIAMHKRVVAAGRDVMGRLPYREYTFIYEDGPGGGLEHLNSATMAGPATVLAKNINSMASLTSHEFFHAWNIKRLRPVNLGPFQYDRESRTKSLWWAEGVTDFYGDYILRRAGILTEEQARTGLAGAIQAYINNPGRARVSPERSSWTTWDANTVNQGYNVSYYLTGGLIGEMFELSLRHRTNGARGIDDVTRYLFDRFAGPKGYTDQDLLKAVNTICGCNMSDFFKRHISGSTPLDFAPFLQYAGWQMKLDTVRADKAGNPLPDLRAGITGFNGVGSLGSYAGSPARLSLSVPDGSFGKAGLNDGDFITAVNGKPVTDGTAFKNAFGTPKVGDRFTVSYIRAGQPATATVIIQPYEIVNVRIENVPNLTEQQRNVRTLWMHGPLPEKAP